MRTASVEGEGGPGRVVGFEVHVPVGLLVEDSSDAHHRRHCAQRRLAQQRKSGRVCERIHRPRPESTSECEPAHTHQAPTRSAARPTVSEVVRCGSVGQLERSGSRSIPAAVLQRVYSTGLAARTRWALPHARPLDIWRGQAGRSSPPHLGARQWGRGNARGSASSARACRMFLGQDMA